MQRDLRLSLKVSVSGRTPKVSMQRALRTIPETLGFRPYTEGMHALQLEAYSLIPLFAKDFFPFYVAFYRRALVVDLGALNLMVTAVTLGSVQSSHTQ